MVGVGGTAASSVPLHKGWTLSARDSLRAGSRGARLSDIAWEGLLAIYGAVLSTALALLRFREWRRRLKVSCRVGSLPSVTGGGPWVIEVACVNVGHRPIEVKDVVLLTTTGQGLTVGRSVYRGGSPHQLPEVIQDGESVVAKFFFSEVERYLNGLNAAAKPPPTRPIAVCAGHGCRREETHGQAARGRGRAPRPTREVQVVPCAIVVDAAPCARPLGCMRRHCLNVASQSVGRGI